MRAKAIGQIAGLTIWVAPSAVVVSVGTWLLLAAAAAELFAQPSWPALLGGLVAVGLHWFSEWWHQFGHAVAARRTGYPMAGIRFIYWLGLSVYPAAEPELPPQVHIRRALGGPAASLLLAGLAGLLILAVGPRGETASLVAWFFFLDNLLFFCLGALLPLGFTDGSTILTAGRQRRSS